MAKSAITSGGSVSGKKSDAPKRLSKWGEWRRANPNGVGLVVHNMRAVLR